MRLPLALLIQESSGAVRHYLDEHEFANFKRVLRLIVVDDYLRAQQLLIQGERLNERAQEYIQVGASAFLSFDEAVSFLIKLTLHATIFPYFAAIVMNEEGIGESDDLARAERLRGVSYYNDFMKSVVFPLAGDRLTCSKDGTIEIGKLFVLEYSHDGEKLSWHDRTDNVIAEFEGVIDDDTETLHGRTAFPGLIRGTVRVIIRPEDNQHFNDGDVLVTINSNPTFMPYIQASSAIIADEGGITCHAAIIARELGKPCIIGTKIGTKVLKDGDTVEVDANKGIVKIVSRAA